MISRVLARIGGALAGRDADIVRWCSRSRQRLTGSSDSKSAARGDRRRAVRIGDLESNGGRAWPVQWVEWTDPVGASGVPEGGVLEGLTRLGNRLLLRINVNGSRRTASLEWDSPPTVDDVEAVLQANLGVEIRALGHLEVRIRADLDGVGA
jgi:hypothetical protein